MKHTFALIGMAGLASLLFSLTAYAQKENEVKETKNTRHIKLAKIENGKKTELDTVVSGDDVFIWNGDTISGAELGKHISPSGFDKMKHVDVFVDRDDEGEEVWIHRNKDRKGGKRIIRHLDSGEDLQLFNEESGDSLQKHIIIRKKMKDGDGDQVIFRHGADMKHFPPVPPVPPVPPFSHMKMQHSGQIIDLNDPTIISYKKKEMSGDREKIEIIRKKSEEPENMTFDFEFDDELIPPPPPEAPEMLREFKDINQKIKITEEEIKGNEEKVKENKAEEESNENK